MSFIFSSSKYTVALVDKLVCNDLGIGTSIFMDSLPGYFLLLNYFIFFQYSASPLDKRKGNGMKYLHFNFYCLHLFFVRHLAEVLDGRKLRENG